jgi:response regulator RpfG family c-di-GMP phosphodiesterase
MSERILFVDDDPNLLAACERNFRRQFPLDTAEGGEAGLAKLAERGPYAVVVADRQMPRMDGVQFLAEVKRRAPDTVRMMLTGNADLEVAIRVVNEGNIFRFLTKPCPPEVLAKALEDACAQYRLVVAEHELFSKTLSGSIKVLSDILAALETKSFGRTERLRNLISEVNSQMPLENAWEIHLAAMLSPIGYVTLPPETVVKARAGEMLSKAEELLVAHVPEISAHLLANIPRLEGVGRIVRYQRKHFDGTGMPADSVKGLAIPSGARLLRVLEDLLELQSSGFSLANSLATMKQRQGWYDPELLDAVNARFGRTAEQPEATPSISITVKDLKVGMTLTSDIYTTTGALIIPSGQRLNGMTLEKIRNFGQVAGVKEPIFVEAPSTHPAKT